MGLDPGRPAGSRQGAQLRPWPLHAASASLQHGGPRLLGRLTQRLTCPWCKDSQAEAVWPLVTQPRTAYATLAPYSIGQSSRGPALAHREGPQIPPLDVGCLKTVSSHREPLQCVDGHPYWPPFFGGLGPCLPSQPDSKLLQGDRLADEAGGAGKSGSREADPAGIVLYQFPVAAQIITKCVAQNRCLFSHNCRGQKS